MTKRVCTLNDLSMPRYYYTPALYMHLRMIERDAFTQPGPVINYYLQRNLVLSFAVALMKID